MIATMTSSVKNVVLSVTEITSHVENTFCLLYLTTASTPRLHTIGMDSMPCDKTFQLDTAQHTLGLVCMLFCSRDNDDGNKVTQYLGSSLLDISECKCTTYSLRMLDSSSRPSLRTGSIRLVLKSLPTVQTHLKFQSKNLAPRMFSEAESEAKKRVIVLGGEVPAMLETDPTMLIGENLTVKGTSFEIIGIFEAKGAVGFRNTDEYAWVPLKTAQYRLTGSEDLNAISVQINPDVPMDIAIIDVERIMRREHRIIPGGKNDFSLSDRKQFLNMQQEAAEIFSYLLAGIAGISLIVGGIGIMNIMLVTVTERTREIGIRKALGATKLNILLQFLIEAMALCIVGGLIGIALGASAASILASLAGWSTPLSFSAVAIAFFFSAGIGLIFGLLPARKAANMDPIAALRYE